MLTQFHEEHEEMRANEQNFCHLAESIGVVFWMIDLARTHLIYVSPRHEQIWGRNCAGWYATTGEWSDALHPEDRERVLEAAFSRQISGEYNEEFRIVRPDGSVRWIHDRAFPVRNEAGEVYRIAGLAEDITDRKKLEQEIIEMSDREQCRVGQDLHDGICQQLVSIAFATDLLRRDLVAKSPPEALRVARITSLLDNAITQTRNLSHALCPVNLVGNGLGLALRELANSIGHGLRIVCDVDCESGIPIHDQAVATHLYRIAQEAVQIATKHANASKVLIRLFQDGDSIHLKIIDNGLGINHGDDHNLSVAMSIMRYRASMAGGGLEIQRNPFGGSIVSCYCGRNLA